jgi:hypothetical protein
MATGAGGNNRNQAISSRRQCVYLRSCQSGVCENKRLPAMVFASVSCKEAPDCIDALKTSRKSVTLQQYLCGIFCRITFRVAQTAKKTFRRLLAAAAPHGHSSRPIVRYALVAMRLPSSCTSPTCTASSTVPSVASVRAAAVRAWCASSVTLSCRQFQALFFGRMPLLFSETSALLKVVDTRSKKQHGTT